MERRKFIRNIGIGSLAIPSGIFDPLISSKEQPYKKILVPQRLQTGDTIGIVSPASAIFESEPYEIAKETFEAMGLKVKLGKYVHGRHGHLAGTDKERAGDIMAMFEDTSVQAIIALRGGSGSARLLDLLDYRVIRKNPKIFIGYSDITALHLAIYEKARLVTFHAPLAVSIWNPFSYSSFRKILFEGKAVAYKNPTDKGTNLVQRENRIRTITPGMAQGELLGGNLSVMTGIMGSDYFPDDWKGKILYLEDVGEKIYSVDRMMTQLQLGGVLNEINGFVFGKCTECEPGGTGYGSLTLEEVIDHYIKPLGIPAFSGAMIGHIDDNSTIPNGIKASIHAGNGIIQLLEPAVL